MSAWGKVTRLFRPRRRRQFAAATFNRLLADWYAGITSVQFEIRGGLRPLRARSRQMIRDNPHAAGYIRALKDNVAGPNGLAYHPCVTNAEGDLDSKVNSELKRAWAEWGRPGICTVDGQLSWVEVQRLAIATMAGDGEFLARKRVGYRNGFGFALQILDPDLLDDTYNVEPDAMANGVRIEMGVELNADGRPIAYHLLQRHRSDIGAHLPRLRAPAEEIIHLFVPSRPGQVRGIPWLTPAMVRLKMLDGFEESHLVASRVGASKPFWFTQDEDAPDEDEGDPNAPPPSMEERIRMDVEPGMGGLLPKGIDVKFFDAKFPSTSFPDFVKSCLRSIASGIGIAYNTFANDLEGVNYGSMRGGSHIERDGYRSLHRIMADGLCIPVNRAWLREALVTRAVRLPTPEVSEWWAAKFTGRGWDWIDPDKDISAFKTEYALRINSLTRICQERGRDFEEILREQAQEKDLAAEYGIEIGEVIVTKPQEPTGADDGTSSTSGAGAAGAGASADDADEDADDDVDGRSTGSGGRIRILRRPDPRRHLLGAAR